MEDMASDRRQTNIPTSVACRFSGLASEAQLHVIGAEAFRNEMQDNSA